MSCTKLLSVKRKKSRLRAYLPHFCYLFLNADRNLATELIITAVSKKKTTHKSSQIIKGSVTITEQLFSLHGFSCWCHFYTVTVDFYVHEFYIPQTHNIIASVMQHLCKTKSVKSFVFCPRLTLGSTQI